MRVDSDDGSVNPSTRPAGPWKRDWLKACTVGELVGFVPPAITGAVLVAVDAPELLLVAGLVAAGALEGLVLGWAQSRVLLWLIPGISGWEAATAIAAGLAWLAGMGGSSLVGAVGARALLVALPGWIIGLLAMGVLQSLRLRRVVADATSWIPATTVAWLTGVAIPVIALSVGSERVATGGPRRRRHCGSGCDGSDRRRNHSSHAQPIRRTGGRSRSGCPAMTGLVWRSRQRWPFSHWHRPGERTRLGATEAGRP